MSQNLRALRQLRFTWARRLEWAARPPDHLESWAPRERSWGLAKCPWVEKDKCPWPLDSLCTWVWEWAAGILGSKRARGQWAPSSETRVHEPRNTYLFPSSSREGVPSGSCSKLTVVTTEELLLWQGRRRGRDGFWLRVWESKNRLWRQKCVCVHARAWNVPRTVSVSRRVGKIPVLHSVMKSLSEEQMKGLPGSRVVGLCFHHRDTGWSLVRW